MAESMSGNKPLRVVFVGNIPYDTTEEQLLDIFRTVGPVLSFRLVFDRDTGKAKGYGFCEYSDPETARSAIRNLNNYEMNGRQLRVDFADSELGTPKDFKVPLKESLPPPPTKGKRKDDKDFDREKELIPSHKDYDYLFQDPSNPHGNYRMPPPVQESYYPPPHHHHHPMHQYPPPPHGAGPSPYGYPHPPPPQGATGHPAYPPPPSGHYEYGPGGHPPPPPHHYRGGPPPPDMVPNYPPGPHGPAPPLSQAPYGYYPPIPPSGGPPPPLGPSQPSLPGPSKMPSLSQHQTTATTQTAPSSAESIANALSSLAPEQILSILSQMKNLVQSNVQIAKNLLTSNPQLTFALFHALWKLDLIDPSTIQRIISHSTGGNPKEATMKEDSMKESSSTGIAAGSGKTKATKGTGSELKERKKESKRTVSTPRGDHPPPPPPSFPPAAPSISSSTSSTTPSTSPSSTFIPSASVPSPSTNQPVPSSVSGGSAPVGSSGSGQTVADQQKALIIRIMQLTQSQIDALPADQREKVLLIKSQIQSQQQSKKS